MVAPLGSSLAFEKNIVPEDSLDTTAGQGRDAQRLHIYVVAESPLERIDIVRSGDISSIRLQGELEWTEERTIPPLGPGEYYYVRVIQQDGGVAWSSPFYGAL